jgi:class 3 adenylate cyclase
MLRYFLLASICLLFQQLTAQSVTELETQLANTTNSTEQLNLTYQLAELYLSQGNEDKAIDYSDQAIELAKGKDGVLLVSSYLINGKAHYGNRDYRRAAAKYRNGLDYAKSYGEIELAIESYLELIQTTKRLRDDGKAARLAEESLTYLKENSNYKKLKNREVNSRNQLARIDQERDVLSTEKARLEQEINNLRNRTNQLAQNNDQLAVENTTLNQRQAQLAEQKAQIEEQKAEIEERVDEQQKSIQQMTAQQAKTRLLAERRAHMLDSLERERELDIVRLENQDVKLENAELQLSRNRYVVGAFILGTALLSLLAILFFVRFRTKQSANKLLEQKNKTIAEERERSDELLLNILPKDIAQELKTTGKAKARRYPETTVMFADFRNFTKMSEVLSPEQLVREIDKCFRAFDMILSQYPDIEKIKTIGDAYMCASGFTDRKSIPKNIIQAALEFQEYLDEVKEEKQRRGLPYFEARIGLHTGPVVAGVVGSKKFAYDIWGDTVNTAARMEQKCEVGQVNISHNTYQLIRYHFDCEHRGRIEAKNKGMVDMYYVLRPANVMA